MKSASLKCNRIIFITARVAKRAKVMFSQASVCSTLGGVTPSASWDRSHGYRGGGQRSEVNHPLGQHFPWTGPTSPSIHTGTTVNGRVVRILLECILVDF